MDPLDADDWLPRGTYEWSLAARARDPINSSDGFYNDEQSLAMVVAWACDGDFAAQLERLQEDDAVYEYSVGKALQQAAARAGDAQQLLSIAEALFVGDMSATQALAALDEALQPDTENALLPGASAKKESSGSAEPRPILAERSVNTLSHHH